MPKSSKPVEPFDPTRPSRFAGTNRLRPTEKENVRQLNSGRGLRPLPYPFGSAVAVVSDVDASSRARYQGYVGMLVEAFGFDFGDSTWLRAAVAKGGDKPLATAGFGFFSRRLDTSNDEDPKTYETTRTLNESVAEFHKGNVDHFHAYSSRGPRVVILDQFATGAGWLEAEPGPFESTGRWDCADLFLFAICVVARPGAQVRVRSISVTESDGTVTDRYLKVPFKGPRDGRKHRLFGIVSDAEAKAWVPQLDQVAKIRIEFRESGDAGNVERVVLASTYPELLLDRLRYLRNRYNVEVGLVTEHAGLHFRNPIRAGKTDSILHRELENRDGLVRALNGKVHDGEGRLVFSTDADEPCSFGRVFPELSTELAVRFIMPSAGGSASGWDILDLVTPSGTRAGTGVYWVRRMIPDIHAPMSGRRMERTKSRQESFLPRVMRILEGAAENPGLIWPLYTHLGGFEDDRTDEHSAPSLYFERGPLCALQDRVFNISGTVESKARTWFTRASVLYDYALMMRSVGGHVERPDADTVQINSWLDPVLERQLPCSAAQLYGLTFYVDDPWNARIRLDSTEVEHLVRNPPDETGRPSVSIAESEIRYPVFERLDPVANAPEDVSVSGGAWSWHAPTADGCAFGRLSVAAGEEHARLTLALHGLAPTGAQLLTYALRPDAGTMYGIVFETLAGGRFFFGDEPLMAGMRKGINACYIMDHGKCSSASWTVLVVPFHDLAWHGSAPGGPFPSHALASVTLLCSGAPGRGIDIGRIAFLRPRATALARRDHPGFCLGGSLPVFEAGQKVYASLMGDPSAERCRAVVDPCGHFCFTRLPPGLYRVWSEQADQVLHDRRGPVVELFSNSIMLVLDQKKPRG